MALFDTHVHYNLEPLTSGQPQPFLRLNSDINLDKSWLDHAKTALNAGVEFSLIPGTNLETSQLAVHQVAESRELYRSDSAPTTPTFYAAVGIHPEEFDHLVNDWWATHSPSQPVDGVPAEILVRIDDQVSKIAQLISASRSLVVAVGEIGLDYYYFNPEQPWLNSLKQLVQQIGFKKQIQLANEFKLPVIVHSRDKTEAAYREILAILTNNLQSAKPFVLHCASGPMDYVQQAIALGAYVGFDGNLTYKNAEALNRLARSVPTDKILLETDAPFLPPTPHRGKLCEPWMVTLTAEWMSTQLHVSATQTTLNAQACFDVQ